MSQISSSKDARPIVAFDVDGTLTWTDSFMLFLRFVAGRRRFFLGLLGLTGAFLLYVFKFKSRDDTKNALLSAFLKEVDQKDYAQKCESFAAAVYPLIARGDGLAALRAHRDVGDTVVLVSASLEDYLQPWAQRLGVEHVLATRLAASDGRLTGWMAGPNCRSDQKLVRIQEVFQTAWLEAAYGDSRGDQEMLAAAKRRGYRIFHDAPRQRLQLLWSLYFGDEMEKRSQALAGQGADIA